MIRIRKGNIGYENKIAEIKSYYDRVDMRKEAYKQKLYLNNLLKTPKSIPYAPQLKFKSLEQINNNIRLRSQILKNQKHFKTQTSITEGKRRNYSMSQLRNDMGNKSINN